MINIYKLISWYEIRDKRVPELQEKNKTVLGKQSYEKAITTFEELNKKPERPQEPILNGIWW